MILFCVYESSEVSCCARGELGTVIIPSSKDVKF